MKKLGISTAVVIGAVLALSQPVLADEKGKKKHDEVKEKIALAGAAKISLDQAVKTASEKVPGQVIEAELEKKHETAVWEVEILTAEGKIMEIHVDAGTGAVIDTEEKQAGKKHEGKHEGKKAHKD
jgi:uncharacterized membrane protein YkoI